MMMLIDNNHYPRRSPVDVPQAFLTHVRNAAYSEESAHRAIEALEKTAEVLGALVDKLVTARVLSEDDVVELLDHSFSVAP